MVAHPYLSLASGIGGLDLGVERGSGGTAGAVCYVEAELPGAAVLAARMEEGAISEAPVWANIRTFDARPWRGKVEGVVAGYPCQPFSLAASNQRQGHDDPRNLWPDVLRIIRESGACWAFLENVEGHLSRGYFDRVRPDLEAAGFRCKEQLLRAVDAGLPHLRRRLFILAVADDPAFQHYAPYTDESESGPGEQPLAASFFGPGGMGNGATVANPDGKVGPQSGVRGLAGEGRGAAVSGPGDLDVGATVANPDGGVEAGGVADAQRGTGDAAILRSGDLDDGTPVVDDYTLAGIALGPAAGDRGLGCCPPRIPGPAEDRAWQVVAASYPHLIPAREPSLWGSADGTASELDLPDGLRLSLLGNAVVPAQAALAWHLLWADDPPEEDDLQGALF